MKTAQDLIGRQVKLKTKEAIFASGIRQYKVLDDPQFQSEVDVIASDNRILLPNMAGTCDMQFGRLTVKLDSNGIVVDVVYG